LELINELYYDARPNKSQDLQGGCSYVKEMDRGRGVIALIYFVQVRNHPGSTKTDNCRSLRAVGKSAY